MIQHILYPFDGTAKCMLAIPQIHELVEGMTAQLTILYVNEGSAYEKSTFEHLRRELSKRTRNDEGLPPPIFAVVEGNAGDEILRYARDHNVDLIAMPTSARTRWQRMFRTSLTELILRKAPCPVWTIGSRKQKKTPTRRIVCAVGNTNSSLAIVQRAANFARRLQAELTLAYAVPELDESTLARMSLDPPILSTAMARRYLQNLAQSLGVRAEYTAQIGPEHQALISIVRNTQADLLLLDRSLHAVMPRVSDVVRRAECAVLVTDATANMTPKRIQRKLDEVVGTVMSLAYSVSSASTRRLSAR